MPISAQEPPVTLNADPVSAEEPQLTVIASCAQLLPAARSLPPVAIAPCTAMSLRLLEVLPTQHRALLASLPAHASRKPAPPLTRTLHALPIPPAAPVVYAPLPVPRDPHAMPPLTQPPAELELMLAEQVYVPPPPANA